MASLWWGLEKFFQQLLSQILELQGSILPPDLSFSFFRPRNTDTEN